MTGPDGSDCLYATGNGDEGISSMTEQGGPAGNHQSAPGVSGRMAERRAAHERVATGGLAPLVVEECTTVTDHQPWLTLRGLELVFHRNHP